MHPGQRGRKVEVGTVVAAGDGVVRDKGDTHPAALKLRPFSPSPLFLT